jgi:hypothetical protein
MNRIAFCSAGALVALLLAGAAPAQAAGCQLGNGIKQIVYIQFDNVHLRRDNDNVPSDLDQMPNLLSFLQNQGTLFTNHHTPLISHTSVDILTSLTGVYGEKMGIPIGNTILYFTPSGTNFTSSFSYWTDNLGAFPPFPPKPVPHMVDQRGKIHPAPWVPFTRAGCDVGAFSVANIELENTFSDVDKVFGPTSPEHKENAKNPDLAAADFEGIAIHCAQGSAICASSTRAVADKLPDEPKGYNNFSALFGNKYVAPAINHGAAVINDLDGNPITDGNGNPGFPGFDPTPSQTLGYLTAMLEAGVPVVYGYIEDAHDNHNYPNAPIANYPDGAFGPGEANYVFQLKAFDTAFGKFFAQFSNHGILANHGITTSNTLFVITSDENDHFAGAAPAQACDGVSTPCTYPIKGEVEPPLNKVLQDQKGDSTPFGYDFDSAPGIWINGNPAQSDPITRKLEREAAGLIGYDPIVGGTNQIMAALADHAEQALLHMVTSDPQRTPNFILFSNPDYFFFGFAGCGKPIAQCFPETRDHAWNHGDFQNDITHTWLGIVGPGVQAMGSFGDVFSDHTDIRPTILSLARLTDDYAHDGRVLFEALNDGVLPKSVRDHLDLVSELAEAYKQINAPLGKLGRKTLTGISTQALTGDDATYSALEAQIVDLTNKRNNIASQMIAILENAFFNGQQVDEGAAHKLIKQAEDLLESIDQGEGDSHSHH